MAISDLIRDVKTIHPILSIRKDSLILILIGKMGMAYSHSHLDQVYKYILNQESHHKKINFKVEYHSFLKKLEIAHDEKYLFDWLDKAWKISPFQGFLKIMQLFYNHNIPSGLAQGPMQQSNKPDSIS